VGLWQDWQAARTSADRQAVIARAFAAAGLVTGQAWASGAFTATITDGPRAAVSFGDGVTILATGSVQIVRTATGADVTPALLNPIQFVLQPDDILVSDPAGAITYAGRTWSEPTPAQLRATFAALLRDAVRTAAGIG
jgi:hypothetical protein